MIHKATVPVEYIRQLRGLGVSWGLMSINALPARSLPGSTKCNCASADRRPVNPRLIYKFCACMHRALPNVFIGAAEVYRGDSRSKVSGNLIKTTFLYGEPGSRVTAGS